MTDDRSPFAGIDLLLIDGNNLLHRVAGSAGSGALRLLVPRLRTVLPSTVETIVMLDGPPDPGGWARQSAVRGLEFRHSGRVDADTAILGLVGARPVRERHRTAVVTDDRALADRVRSAGGVPRRLAWLQALLDVPATELGRGPRQPSRTAGDPAARPTGGDAAEEIERGGWRPGRGATRKRGNPRRRPRS